MYAGAAALEDSRLGAQVMFHAGDLVEVAMLVVVMAAWYRQRQPPRRPALQPSTE